MSAFEIDDRIRTAYLTAHHAATSARGGRVEIHIGSAVLEHLKTLATEAIEPHHEWQHRGDALWGFPLIPVVGHRFADHISVHTVQHIL